MWFHNFANYLLLKIGNYNSNWVHWQEGTYKQVGHFFLLIKASEKKNTGDVVFKLF